MNMSHQSFKLLVIHFTLLFSDDLTGFYFISPMEF